MINIQNKEHLEQLVNDNEAVVVEIKEEINESC